MSSTPQKRLQERFRTTGTVTFSFREGWFGRKTLSGLLVDVSAEGLQARLPALGPVGRRVQIIMALGDAGGDAALYRFAGKIMWSKEDQMGGQFLAGVRMDFRSATERRTWQNIIYEALRSPEADA